MYAAVLDIETSDLAAVGAGIVLVVCVRPMQTQRTRTFQLDMYEYEPDPLFGFLEREETDLIKAVQEELSKYHILIGHNIERFDLPYLRSRAFRLGVNWVILPALYDTLRAFRRTHYLTRQNGFGKPSGSLAMVADFAGVKQEKTNIFPREHWKSVWGNKQERSESIHQIAVHCQKDVRLNANVFPFLWAADMKPSIRKIV